MLNKNEQYILEISGMGAEGEGVGRIEGFAVFVPFALLGEKILVKIVKVQKNYAFGKIVEIITPSPSRISPSCKHFYKCGGCSFQHCDYNFELEYKKNKVSEALKRIGGIEAEVSPIIPAENTVGYRNKSQFPVNTDGIGFYANRSHRLVPVESCEIQHTSTHGIIKAISEYMKKYSILPYDEASHTGDIRHVFTRVSKHSGEIMVGIVTRTKRLANVDELVRILRDSNENIVSIIQSINSEKTNVALGEKEVLLWGKDYITDKIGDLSFEISLKSFYQINPQQTKKLYDEVVKLINFTGDETLFDLYCGIGTISLYVAKYVKKVIGVEIVEKAVENAIKNAKINGIENAQFVVGAAEDVAKSLGTADIVIVDPPRKGCDEKLLKTIVDIAPESIVYVSCNPSTLARDLKFLTSNKYYVKKVVPIDMFPRTPHVECVVLMSRVDK